MARKVFTYIFILVLATFLIPAESKAETVSKVTVKDLIVKHSMEMGMDPAMALSIAKAESNFCHERRSKYGAVGVFQLMPATAKRMGYNPYHVNDNIKGGIQYYKNMYKMFGSPELALAAYNAGPGNVKKYNGVPPFTETRKFVSSIMNSYNNFKANPDPAIARYNNGDIKEISTAEYDEEIDFRMQHEAILKSYLSNQGI